MAPTSHRKGSGCPKCKPNAKLTQEDILEKFRNTHGDKYNYDKVIYINSNTKVIITCQIHGDFEQTPSHHANGTNCPKCNGTIPLTNEEFIKRSKEIHGERYLYHLVNVISTGDPVSIVCQIHGVFNQIVGNHIYNKHGCPYCAGNVPLSTELFIERSKLINGDKYTYDYTIIAGAHNKTIITCVKHGNFKQTPANHLNKKEGCPKCSDVLTYSKVQIQWLNCIAIYYPSIQHALKEGEYKIENSRYSADGYVPEINTIFEFHGCFYHAHPSIIKENLLKMFIIKQ
jgi:hypothetical protein